MINSLVICGPISSGKTTAATYLRDKYGYTVVSASEIVSSFARQENSVITREILQSCGRQLISSHGHDWLAKIMVEKCDKHVVYEGIRPMEVVEYIKKNVERCKILYLQTDYDIRVNRFICARGESKAKYDIYMSDPLESCVASVINIADHIVNNDGNNLLLYQEIDKIINDTRAE